MSYSYASATPFKSYTDTLAANQQNYENILGAYTKGQGALSAGLGNIYGGYGDVQKQVMNTLGVSGGGWGVAAPAAQEIADTFNRQQGQTDQQMINAGLGNTTVRGAMRNQNTLMAGRAYGNLGAQLAQTAAGYEAQLGTARLGAQMQGLGMQANMYGEQGRTLGGYHFPFVPPSTYGIGASAPHGVTPIMGSSRSGPSITRPFPQPDTSAPPWGAGAYSSGAYGGYGGGAATYPYGTYAGGGVGAGAGASAGVGGYETPSNYNALAQGVGAPENPYYGSSQDYSSSMGGFNFGGDIPNFQGDYEE